MSQTKVRFGPFELDTRAGELHRGSRRLRLQEKPLKVLEALIEQPGQVVTREELRARLWPANMFVDFDNGLNNAINKLRGVLGDSAETPKYVETVGRRGYRFIGELVTSEPEAIESRDSDAQLAPAVIAPASTAPAELQLGTSTQGSGDVPIIATETASLTERGARRRQVLLLGTGAVVALGAAALTSFGVRQREGGAGPRISSLAVLPLDNLSDDPEQEYFSDGMTDALISQLAGIRSLRIISRQSIMRYKGSTLAMPDVARELNVEGVIEGTVLRGVDRIRITVQLIHAPSDTHLWSEQYERPLTDVMALQAGIARDVAEKVQAVVTVQETARLASQDAVDPKAYDLYLRGRYFWAQRHEESLHRSLDYFQRALAIEAKFARVHAAIAEAYGPLGYLGYLPPDEASPKMRAAAERALELDPDLVEGLTALGACAAFHEWKWAEGERHFQRAIEISASYVTTFMWYGLLLENTGRQAENLRARQRAFELDPLAVGAGAALGSALFYNGKVDEGAAVLERTLELDPASPQPLMYLGKVYLAAGRYADAIEVFARARDDGGLGHAYGVAGRAEEARAVLARLEQQARADYVPPFSFVLVHVGLGNVSAALETLERGFAIRDPGMSGIKVDLRMQPLAQEPRFVALLQKMGLQ